MRRLRHPPAHRRVKGPTHRLKLLLASSPVVSGPVSRLTVRSTVGLADVLINTVGGHVDIGNNVFFGHDVMLLTGSHDFRKKGSERQQPSPISGRDIVIEEGAWIASRAIIIGPAHIGANAVIGCGCVVDFDVPPNTIVRMKQEFIKEAIAYL